MQLTMSRLPDPDEQAEAGGGGEKPTLRSWAAAFAEVGSSLRENGAVGVMLVDASALAALERRYGVQAYRNARQKLCELIEESCQGVLGDRDVITMGSDGDKDEVVVLFCSKRESGFYRDELPAAVVQLASG